MRCQTGVQPELPLRRLPSSTGIAAGDMKSEILTSMGDEIALADSFEGLYRTSCAEMTRLAYLITGSLHVAEEVTHDSFIAVQRRWDSIDHPRAYLRQTVVNRSRSHLRRLQVQRSAPIEPSQPVLPQEIDETWQLVQQLPIKRRTAVVLRYYLDLPIAEIAALMNVRSGTVKSLLHRGRETLRKQLT